MQAKSIIFHIVTLILSSIVLYFVSSYFDVFEIILEFIEKHEEYELDEIYLIFTFSTFYFLFVSIVISTKLRKRNAIVQRLSNKLQKENITKDKYQAIIAHDLKSPFNAIIGFSDILLDQADELSAEERTKMLELINRTSKSSFALLENLLQWSRIQGGQILPHTQKLNISEAVIEVYYELESGLERKNINFTKQVNPDHWAIADENMLKLIIRNLLSNAIKYSHPKGEIKIVSYLNEGFANIGIIDQGVGLSQKQIADIFSHEQKSTLGTDNEKGTGFGLEICKEFIEQLGGKLSIESEKNKGSTFSFSLPEYQGDEFHKTQED